MKVRWSPEAAALDHHQLTIGPYRVKYVIDGDVITIERVDRLI